MKKVNTYMPGLAIGVYFLVMVMLYQNLSWTGILSSLGLGVIVYSITESVLYSSVVAIFGLFIVTTIVPKSDKEGFNTVPSKELSEIIKKMKAAEGFEGVAGLGIGVPVIEGFENSKKESSVPAPSADTPKVELKKDSMPQPFTLGEIPSQVKNGPHIDTGATLMKAIQSLNPEQINAMTNDTKQLIDTQKSLMSMLGTMKPMLNDGKQLMDTFQDMFGK